MAPIEIRFDRPFLFVIRDTKTGTILSSVSLCSLNINKWSKNEKKLILSLLSILLICNACVSSPTEDPVIDPQPDDSADLQTEPVDYDPEELDGLVIGHNQFALALYKLLAEKMKTCSTRHTASTRL